jgi:CHAT domain-containing protein
MGPAQVFVFFAFMCSLYAAPGSAVAESFNSQGDRVVESAASSADDEMARGKMRFRQGAFAQAAVHWMEAARTYEKQGRTTEQCQALINLAHALEQEGQIKRAMTTLQAALRLSEQSGSRIMTASILGRLGNAFFALGKGDLALDHLKKALTIARNEKKNALTALLLNDLGNVLAGRNQFAEAIDVYTETKTFADQTGQHALAATAQTNMALAFLDDEQLAASEKQLDQAFVAVQELENSYAKAYALLNIGLGYEDLQTALSSPRMRPQEAEVTLTISPLMTSLMRQASDSFVAAAKVATELGDSRAQSYAWGHMGHLLEKERRYSEALNFTRRAVLAAQKGNAPESSYQWQWQTARLLRASGKEDDALAAYNRAVTILKPIRYEYSVGYQGRHNSFRDSVAPLFIEFEDTLLRRADAAQTPQEEQDLLIQVRNTVEASRTAELQDYFRDDCVAMARSRRGGSHAIPQNTAVLYPIILPDRLELLISLSGRLKHYSVAVTAEQLIREIRTFRRTVQDPMSRNYLSSAQALYQWLMAPLQPEFLAAGVTTVVVVPDGPLRTIPISALHDGREFVVNRYAIGVTPSMDLTDSRPLHRSEVNLLTMGLTESVRGFPALPNVASEVQKIRALYGGHVLMDNEFVVPSMEREMKENGVGILHIASHGVVENDVNDSYLLAYDDKVTMDRLSQLVGLLQYRQDALELLTLSACKTAVGDDRAALGLAGVAVKAGARSALATLWFIDDKSTSELVGEFYRQLQDSSVTKAVSLQRAQLKLMSDPGYEHPSFWAPFLLINNWF